MTPRMLLPMALVLAGCAQTVRFPPDLWNWDEDFPPEEGQWIDPSSIQAHCETDNTWWWQVFINGVSGSATLHVLDGARSETHEMRLAETDEGEGWDWYELGPLTSNARPDEQVPGQSSLFNCDSRAFSIGGAVVVEDRFDNLVDCVWWGDRSDQTPELVQTEEIEAIGGCRWIER